eukprot:Gb_34548 [translate_table: standard]
MSGLTATKIYFIAVLFIFLFNLSVGDVGTASSYNAPYVPTSCYGYDQGQFPAGNLFAAANDAIWDNKAACGRQYRVRCLSGNNRRGGRPCRGRSIVVKIVDHCASPQCGATFHLSTAAFAAITDSKDGKINIEYEKI